MKNLSIQIPLFNETEALEFSKFYFDSINVDVNYVLDSQCEHETRTLVNKLGVNYSEFKNDKPYIENGYRNFAEASPTDWILRIDCDELPTPELIHFANSFVAAAEGVVSFERLQVLWKDEGFIRPVDRRFDPKAQRQYRLFNRRKVEFHSAIHTPGIYVDAPIHAPPEACLYHMSWIFLSWQQRLAKADRYDTHGQPTANRENQLYAFENKKLVRLPPTIVDTIYSIWLNKQ